MSKIKMCAVLAVGLFFVGCGDDSYNYDNDAATIEAIKLEFYDKMYNKFDPRLEKF
jgi:putative lipoprotein